MSKTAPNAERSSSTNINRLITNVKRSTITANENIHLAVVGIIEHASNYGDCSGAGRLFDAMPKSFRRALVQRAFQRYSPISVYVNSKGATVANFRNTENKEYNVFDIEGAKANPWHSLPEAQREPDLMTSEDFVDGLNKFIERWTKRIAEPEGKIVANDVVGIKRRLDALRSFKMDNLTPATNAA